MTTTHRVFASKHLDHGNCPACKANLNGGSIWHHYYTKALNECYSDGEAIELADKSAAFYGANREMGQWGREIGIYSRERDRTVAWECPDCGHRWDR